MIQIFIKFLDVKAISLEVEKTDTIKTVKIKIYEEKNIPPDIQRLIIHIPYKELEDEKTINDYNILNKSTIYCVLRLNDWCPSFKKEINIKFLTIPKDMNKSYFSNFFKMFKKNKEELYGLLKLCFLKEISLKIDKIQMKKLPEFISYILEILKYGYIEEKNPKEDIKKLLEKIKGSNILNFSNFIDNTINSSDIKTILQYLNKEDYEIIKNIKKRLMNYNEYIQFFEKDFEERKRNSIFDFSIISIVILEREDFKTFENEKKNCKNRVDKILYHETNRTNFMYINTIF